MSKEMKMADYFDLPLSMLCCDAYGNELNFEDMSIGELKGVSQAINSHDRLTEENAALREALRLKEAECEALAGDKKRLIDAMDLQIMAPDAVNSSTGRTVSIENALLLTELGGSDEQQAD